MRSIRKVALLGVAVLLCCAFAASSASALTMYYQTTGAALAVGESITGTQSGTGTISGSFFGFSVTIQCTGHSWGGAITSNGGTTVTASTTSASWSGCSSNLKSPCSVTPVGLPWNASNSGGLVATSTTSMGLGLGSGTGAINVTDCLNGLGSCTVTGATASYGGWVKVLVGFFQALGALFELNTAMQPKACTAQNVTIINKVTIKGNNNTVNLK